MRPTWGCEGRTVAAGVPPCAIHWFNQGFWGSRPHRVQWLFLTREMLILATFYKGFDDWLFLTHPLRLVLQT